MFDALYVQHARHDGALSYRSMSVGIAKVEDD